MATSTSSTAVLAEGQDLSDYLKPLELSIKTSNLLRDKNVTEAQFINLKKEDWKFMGGLVRGWKEIEEVQPVARELRIKRRRESTIGRACIAVRELNDITGDLAREDLFITRDTKGRFRIGRYITREDFSGI